jgi:hypothetical protein
MRQVTEVSPPTLEQRLKEAVSVTFSIALVLNFLSVVVGVDGSAWHLLRVVVGVLFLIALVAWIGALIRRRVMRAQAG